jgi:hypothetical protein
MQLEEFECYFVAKGFLFFFVLAQVSSYALVLLRSLLPGCRTWIVATKKITPYQKSGLTLFRPETKKEIKEAET